MTIIYAATEDQCLVATILPKIAQNGVDTVRLSVAFDSSWDALPVRSAVFYTSLDARPYKVQLSSDGDCFVPPEVLKDACKLYITVEGEDASGRVKPSTRLTVKVLEGTPVVIVSDPTPNVYQQLATAYTNLVARFDNLIRLEDGSTTGDAELIDARVDENGKTHLTLGAALRDRLSSVVRSADYHVHSSNYGTYFNSFNDAKNGCIYFINSNITSDMVADLPEYGAYAIAVTLKLSTSSSHGLVQLYFNFKGSFYWRMEVGAGSDYNWTDWLNIARKSDIPSSFALAVGSRNVSIAIDEEAYTYKVTKNSTDNGHIWTQYSYISVGDLVVDEISLIPEDNAPNTYIVYIRDRVLQKALMTQYVPKDKDIVLSILYLHSTGAIFKNIYTVGLLESLVEDIKTAKTNSNTCSIFARVCCCGDSYTSGHISVDGVTTVTNEKFSYPAFMAKLTGNEYINCGQSGANVLTWQTATRGLLTAQATGKVQAYLVGLGLNDIATGTTRFVELGTAADIGTEAKTYYGGLSKIIRELNAISPKAFIFVQTMPFASGLALSYNEAIREVVAAYSDDYNVHLLDLYAYRDLYKNASLTGDSVGGHYTAIGYQQFAEILRFVWSDYINNNISTFQNVHLIEYDTETGDFDYDGSVTIE